MKTLVIVESPAKAKTITTFLKDKDFKVIASMGHVRNLPKSDLGIDLEDNFNPKYIVPRDKSKLVTGLKKDVKAFDKIILASDEDREGEAIAWHLKEVLKINEENYERIVFHEITPEAIHEAIKNPRKINLDMVYSQQARRILDRLVGYKLSPFLWKKILKGLSAGRVQTPALRLIVEKENEIEKFKEEEYWSVEGLFFKDKVSYTGNLTKIEGKTLDQFEFKTKKDVSKIEEELTGTNAKVVKIEKTTSNKKTLPPFTTSTLQQAAYSVCHFSAKKTMQVAQRLYEGIDIDKKRIGLITYMRTDSLNLSASSIQNAREFVASNFGKDYIPEKPNYFKAKSKMAQEAHEAIRATDSFRTPELMKPYLASDELKLYTLIWNRFVACQMKDAILERTVILSESMDAKKKYLFQTNLQFIKFEGFLKVLPIVEVDKKIEIKENEIVKIKKIDLKQHFTLPPARFNDASLVKTLEKCGIGRPSTYANIISILIERGYVNYNDSKCFVPTDIGKKTCNILVDNFQNIADYDLTKKIEDELDRIAEAKIKWTKVVKDFYEPFAENLKAKYEEVQKIDLIEDNKTDEICPNCGSNLIIKMSRFGKFMACPGFPKCKFTKSINELKIECPKCKKGNIVQKRTKRGKVVYGCNKYPECDFIVNKKPLDEKCEKCGYPLILKNKTTKICTNKECNTEVENTSQAIDKN